MKQVLSLIGGFLLAVSVSQAALIVNFVSQGTVGAGAHGGTDYTYDIDVSDDTTVRPVDYVVIYDFGPVLGFLTSDANWSLGVRQAMGPYPPGQTPNEDNGADNVQVVYSGANITGPAFTGFSDLTITLESPYSTIVNGTLNVSAQFSDSTGASVGDTRDLPVPISGVPEPGTMCLIGSALLGAGMLLRRHT